MDLTLIAAPLAGGLLILVSHVSLGRQVIKRGIVFIDLAIAQLAGLGVLLAATLNLSGWLATALAAAVSLLGAALVATLSHVWPARREALIGLVYVGAAAFGMVWVSADPHGAQRLAGLLAGDVLWVDWPQLLPLAVLTAVLVPVGGLRAQALERSWVFYPVFALLVSLSVPLAGVYLVFASLIAPVLAVPGERLWPAFVLGSVGYLVGLLLSLWADWPSGPCVVLMLLMTGSFSAVYPIGSCRTHSRSKKEKSYDVQ
ncbi:hypothetical protein CSQ89_00745 [Chitinimonas sp. BJB300]|nr:hypothetical protein CSQ89_00745 [Chitinimonas sp. BJB300]TSJ90177.1 metal ABC transporter permease [Chitinimonas sp. BJB300]